MIIENKNGTNFTMYLFYIIDNIYDANLLYMPRHERNRDSRWNSKQIELTWRPGKYSKNNIHQKPEYIYKDASLHYHSEWKNPDDYEMTIQPRLEKTNIAIESLRDLKDTMLIDRAEKKVHQQLTPHGR